MNDIDKLGLFPKSSIKAYDGMPVTAGIWEAAHAEHRDEIRAHALMLHREGIKFGLEVKANDPADHYVFISPGVAVDALGRVIVVDQTIAYDFGDEGEGTFRLYLGYGEREVEDADLSVKRSQREYIVAARETAPKQPAVELARVMLQKKNDVIRDALNVYKPGPGELDLRFRQDKPWTTRLIRVGVIALGNVNENVAEGWRVMGQSLPYMLPFQISVDHGLTVDADLSEYDVIHIYVSGIKSLDKNAATALQKIMTSGKGLLLEGLDADGFEALKSLAVQNGMLKLDAGSAPVFNRPYFFRQPPEGISAEHLFGSGKMLLISDQTSIRWSGVVDGKEMTRAEIRTDLEWGANILMCCAE